MTGVTRAEFSKIYREQFVPILEPLEQERLEIKRKTAPFNIPIIIFIVVLILGFAMSKGLLIVIGLAVVISCSLYVVFLWNKIRKKLKKQIITKVLSLCGNMYLSDNIDVVSSSEIDNMGLYPRFTSRIDDDVIIGIHKGCNFAIEETCLLHTEGSGKHSHTVTDFEGLIVKIQMNKNFNGQTVVGVKGQINKQSGFDEVKLEDIEFMKHMKVFSTDQIESRYLLTPAMIERLYALGETFSKRRRDSVSSSAGAALSMGNITQKISKPTGFWANFIDGSDLVSAAFIDGYVYLFVPKYEDFFEIDTGHSLLDEMKYYDVYCQLQLILSIIEYLKLDLKLGL